MTNYCALLFIESKTVESFKNRLYLKLDKDQYVVVYQDNQPPVDVPTTRFKKRKEVEDTFSGWLRLGLLYEGSTVSELLKGAEKYGLGWFRTQKQTVIKFLQSEIDANE